jgi:hypothetical protein
LLPEEVDQRHRNAQARDGQDSGATESSGSARDAENFMIDFEEGSTNVYADLGRADAEEMLVKAQLAAKIAGVRPGASWPTATTCAAPTPRSLRRTSSKSRSPRPTSSSSSRSWTCCGRAWRPVIKDAKLKVDASINGDKLRVTGKKRDDLQLVIALLKKADLPLPLQFENFRD